MDTTDLRNTPSTTNLKEEEIMAALENDGNTSILEQFSRPNPWRKMMMIINLNLISQLLCQNYLRKRKAKSPVEYPTETVDLNGCEPMPQVGYSTLRMMTTRMTSSCLKRQVPLC
jgi:hypothetical protein